MTRFILLICMTYIAVGIPSTKAVPFTDVDITDTFRGPRLERNRAVLVAYNARPIRAAQP
jgi:hypothetical protein